MARKTIKPIDLENVLKEILTKYGDDVYEVLSKAVEDVSNEAAKKLQAGGPYGGTGAYKKTGPLTTSRRECCRSPELCITSITTGSPTCSKKGM